MGNDIKTAAGTVGTVATGTAFCFTLGQIEALEKATIAWAEFTGESWNKSLVGNTTKTAKNVVTSSVGVVGTAATFGQVDAMNKFTEEQLSNLAESSETLVKETYSVGKGIATSTPGVGHVVGGVQMVCGYTDSGLETMDKSTRTTAVMGGGMAGLIGGPAGAIAGGIAAGTTYDGVTTWGGSLAKGKFTPRGQIGSIAKIVNGQTGQDKLMGVVETTITTATDGFTGYSAAKLFKSNPAQKSASMSQSDKVAKSTTTTTDLRMMEETKELSSLFPDKAYKDPFASNMRNIKHPLYNKPPPGHLIESYGGDYNRFLEINGNTYNGMTGEFTGIPESLPEGSSYVKSFYANHPSVNGLIDPKKDIINLLAKYPDLIPKDGGISKQAFLELIKNDVLFMENYLSENSGPSLKLTPNFSSPLADKVLHSKKFSHLSKDLLKSGKQVLNEKESLEFFMETVKISLKECSKISGFEKCPQNVKKVVINMCHHMGLANFRKCTGVIEVTKEIAKGMATPRDLLKAINKLTSWTVKNRAKVADYEQVLRI